MWGELAKDAPGILLFLVWLVLPPLYTVVLGRSYVRQCNEAAQNATCAADELQQAVEDVEDLLESQRCSEGSSDADPTEAPQARTELRPDDTQELSPASVCQPDDSVGKHRLDPSRLTNAHA